MRRRVTYPDTNDYARYGGRGIKVYPEWDRNFEAFLDHVGLPPSSAHSLDRIDSNRDYEPGNVRWATLKEQNRNKSDNVYIEWRGRRMLLIEAAEISGLPVGTVRFRICRAGWDVEKALTEPVRKSARWHTVP